MALKTKKDGASWRERLSVALDIPSDIFPGSTCVQIRGRECVSVGGGRTIELYTDTEICIGCADGLVVIGGRRLCCRSFRRGAVTVTGRIDTLRFEEKK